MSHQYRRLRKGETSSASCLLSSVSIISEKQKTEKKTDLRLPGQIYHILLDYPFKAFSAAASR